MNKFKKLELWQEKVSKNVSRIDLLKELYDKGLISIDTYNESLRFCRYEVDISKIELEEIKVSL